MADPLTLIYYYYEVRNVTLLCKSFSRCRRGIYRQVLLSVHKLTSLLTMHTSKLLLQDATLYAAPYRQ